MSGDDLSDRAALRLRMTLFSLKPPSALLT
jgi:hypothetical protein